METLTVQENHLPAATTPDQLLSLAVSKDIDIDKLDKLLAMKERWEATQARKAFFESLATFQTKCPVLVKKKQVAFGQTKYKYAPLSDIVEQIKSLLGEVGLTYRWENKSEGNQFNITCIVTHKDGHSESTSMTASADKSGNKNDIQAVGSTITYLQRYTLIGALGISSADEDNDGKHENLELLHGKFMEIYNQLIQIDSKKYSKYHPDNWNCDLTARNYKAAIADVSNVLKAAKQ